MKTNISRKEKKQSEQASESADSVEMKTSEEISGQDKLEKNSGLIQHPKIVGYHGTDDEKELSPEE